MVDIDQRAGGDQEQRDITGVAHLATILGSGKVCTTSDAFIVPNAGYIPPAARKALARVASRVMEKSLSHDLIDYRLFGPSIVGHSVPKVDREDK
jgi:hypothetical protein